MLWPIRQGIKERARVRCVGGLITEAWHASRVGGGGELEGVEKENLNLGHSVRSLLTPFAPPDPQGQPRGTEFEVGDIGAEDANFVLEAVWSNGGGLATDGIIAALSPSTRAKIKTRRRGAETDSGAFF